MLPALGHKGPELRAIVQFKAFKRDEALETYGGYGFQVVEIYQPETCDRCRKKKVRAGKRKQIWEWALNHELIKRGECVEAPPR